MFTTGAAPEVRGKPVVEGGWSSKTPVRLCMDSYSAAERSVSIQLVFRDVVIPDESSTINMDLFRRHTHEKRGSVMLWLGWIIGWPWKFCLARGRSTSTLTTNSWRSYDGPNARDLQCHKRKYSAGRQDYLVSRDGAPWTRASFGDLYGAQPRTLRKSSDYR
ncbi:hypothetical protein PG997_008249 [Apiospora hydei]|uniref:Uncharacterized protein n=1 Tax=Apiospora hydei TaxID=1337664 RepID=A0ABR1WAB7_9PEZI